MKHVKTIPKMRNKKANKAPVAVVENLYIYIYIFLIFEMRFCDRIILGLSSECRRIVFLLAEAIHGVSAEILNLQISWQAQYLVRLEADCACSAHCK